jgi:hypothetical protein
MMPRVRGEDVVVVVVGAAMIEMGMIGGVVYTMDGCDYGREAGRREGSLTDEEVGCEEWCGV